MYATIILLVLVFLLIYRFNKLKQKEEETIDSFWTRENNANFTPKKDISNLSYITIPLEKFPQEYLDAEEENLFMELKNLSEKKILNLYGVTNTSLKENYGLYNLKSLQEMGDNFDTLSTTIVQIAEKRFNNKDYSSVITMLEFLVSKKTDISKAYIILGDTYNITNKKDKISDLISMVKELNLPLEKKIISSLLNHLENIDIS